jgi:hypothetical protein
MNRSVRAPAAAIRPCSTRAGGCMSSRRSSMERDGSRFCSCSTTASHGASRSRSTSRRSSAASRSDPPGSHVLDREDLRGAGVAQRQPAHELRHPVREREAVAHEQHAHARAIALRERDVAADDVGIRARQEPRAEQAGVDEGSGDHQGREQRTGAGQALQPQSRATLRRPRHGRPDRSASRQRRRAAQADPGATYRIQSALRGPGSRPGGTRNDASSSNRGRVSAISVTAGLPGAM